MDIDFDLPASGPDSGDGASTTSNDSDSQEDGNFDAAFWANVPWDWIANETEFTKVWKEEILPANHPVLHKNRPKHMKKPDGTWEYVQFIPRWTDPDWDDEYKFIEAPGADPVRMKRVGDVFSKLRPALLLKDALKNPTAMAKRFGMHPDQHDGRSRISPSMSLTRRVGLPIRRLTPSGHMKAYVDFEDLEAAKIHYLHEGLADTDEALQLRLQSDCTSNDVAVAELAAALLALRQTIEEDKNYQRALFHQFTTDEVCTHTPLFPLLLPIPPLPPHSSRYTCTYLIRFFFTFKVDRSRRPEHVRQHRL